jgi:transcriptional regulator
MAKNESLQGALDLLVLKILAKRGPLHGYGITLQIEQISEDVLRVEEGSLYPAMHRMEEAGWIQAAWMSAEGGKRRARYYEITQAGRQRLEAEELRWNAVTGAVSRVLALA